jgi:hypothetical protein
MDTPLPRCELHTALVDFRNRYNENWIIERLNYRTPLQARRAFQMTYKSQGDSMDQLIPSDLSNGSGAIQAHPSEELVSVFPLLFLARSGPALRLRWQQRRLRSYRSCCRSPCCCPWFEVPSHDDSSLRSAGKARNVSRGSSSRRDRRDMPSSERKWQVVQQFWREMRTSCSARGGSPSKHRREAPSGKAPTPLRSVPRQPFLAHHFPDPHRVGLKRQTPSTIHAPDVRLRLAARVSQRDRNPLTSVAAPENTCKQIVCREIHRREQMVL